MLDWQVGHAVRPNGWSGRFGRSCITKAGAWGASVSLALAIVLSMESISKLTYVFAP